MDNQSEFLRLSFGSESLYLFVLDHLNRICCAKTHLAERFSEIAEDIRFTDLRLTIEATIKQVENQVAGMNRFYKLLKIEPSFNGCDELIAFLENSFSPIQRDIIDVYVRDMSLLSYLTYIKSIEIASYAILHLVANKIKSMPIRNLLNVDFEESKLDRAMLAQLTSKYA